MGLWWVCGSWGKPGLGLGLVSKRDLGPEAGTRTKLNPKSGFGIMPNSGLALGIDIKWPAGVQWGADWGCLGVVFS